MSSYKDIPNIDATILDRITEADVEMWMAAKIQSLRTDVPAHHLAVSVNFAAGRRPEIYSSWNFHAGDKCAMEASIGNCRRIVKEELLNNPKKRAAEFRRKAAVLLKEAAELESFSSETTKAVAEVAA